MAPKIEIVRPVPIFAAPSFRTGVIPLTGIGTGAAYASGDAFGAKGSFLAPVSGIIQTAIYYDLDDEGLEMDMVRFRADFVATADNSPFDPTDLDLQLSIGTVTWLTTDFKNFANSQIATARGLGQDYVAPEGRIYYQFVARGAVNIAASNLPAFQFFILPDVQG